MKVIDTVNKHLAAHPSLYLKDSWERSKFAILHHIFIVLGNGIEWAQTKDPRCGGYLTNPIMKKIDDEWTRVDDRNYGEVKFNLDPRFFKEQLYEYGIIKHEEDWIFKLMGARLSFNEGDYEKIRNVFESQIPRLRGKWVKEGEKNIPKDTKFVLSPRPREPITIAGITSPEQEDSPYPNFQKEYSPFWESGCDYIQEDWRLAAIEHLEHWKKYFVDDARTIHYHFRWKGKTVEEVIQRAKEGAAKKNEKDWIEYLRREWVWPGFNPDKSNQENADDNWFVIQKPKTQKFLDETLAKLQSKNNEI